MIFYFSTYYQIMPKNTSPFYLLSEIFFEWLQNLVKQRISLRFLTKNYLNYCEFSAEECVLIPQNVGKFGLAV